MNNEHIDVLALRIRSAVEDKCQGFVIGYKESREIAAHIFSYQPDTTPTRATLSGQQGGTDKDRFVRYHLEDRTPFDVTTAEGSIALGQGWLIISEAEYATLSGQQGGAVLAGCVAEPAVVVDLGHGRWTIDYGTHQGHEALFFEPAPAAGPPMTPAPAFLPPDLVQPGTVCLRFDVPEAMTFLRWWLAYVQDPANTPTDPAEFAAAKMFRAFPAEHEDRQDASALSRALAIHDALPDEFRPADNTPLRNCLPGIWPTVGDLRAALAAPMSAALQDVIAERESQIANGRVAAPQGVRDFFIQGIACGLAEVERLDRLGWQTEEESE